MSNGPNAFDRFLSLFMAFLLTAITVILALLLVEFKHMTDRDRGIIIRGADHYALDIALAPFNGVLGSSQSYPFWMKVAQ